MFKTKTPKSEGLDRLAEVILRSAVAEEKEMETAASSAFLFTRVRAAIVANKRPAEAAGGGVTSIVMARRAVPAMAVVATFAALLTVWPSGPALTGTSIQSDDEALFGMPDPGVEQTVLTSRNGLSRDEIFNIVVDRNYEVKRK